MSSKGGLRIIITAALLVVSQICYGEINPQKISATIDGYIQNKFVNATYKFCDGDEKNVWQGAAGYHTKEAKTSEDKRLTDYNQQMPIASATKPFTAAMILKLQEQGKLNVNDPITKYIGQESGDFSYEDKQITIHHLLSHNSGLSEYFGRVKAGPSMSIADINKNIIAYAAKTPLKFTPGEKHEYINTNYVLLGIIIERVSKKELRKHLQDEILTPIGLKDTKLASLDEAADFQATPNKTLLPNRYLVHLNDGETKYELLKSRFFMSPFADGGMVSTVGDLIKWQKALHGGKVLSPESYKLMITRHIITDKSLPGSKKYAGYGMYISDFDDGKVIYEHAGNAEAIRAESGYVANKNFFFASLSNVMPKDWRTKEGLSLDVRNFTGAVLLGL